MLLTPVSPQVQCIRLDSRADYLSLADCKGQVVCKADRRPSTAQDSVAVLIVGLYSPERASRIFGKLTYDATVSMSGYVTDEVAASSWSWTLEVAGCLQKCSTVAVAVQSANCSSTTTYGETKFSVQKWDSSSSDRIPVTKLTIPVTKLTSQQTGLWIRGQLSEVSRRNTRPLTCTASVTTV